MPQSIQLISAGEQCLLRVESRSRNQEVGIRNQAQLLILDSYFLSPYQIASFTLILSGISFKS